LQELFGLLFVHVTACG
jgi:hypothetical protein